MQWYVEPLSLNIFNHLFIQFIIIRSHHVSCIHNSHASYAFLLWQLFLCILGHAVQNYTWCYERNKLEYKNNHPTNLEL